MASTLQKLSCINNHNHKFESLSPINQIYYAPDHNDNGANIVDICCIPNSGFKIEFLESLDTTPIRCAEYPHNIKDVDEIERQLEVMVQMKLISRSESSWRFPTFIIPKKNGEARIVFDYRKLNTITKRLAHSLPSVPNLMRRFKGKT